MKISKPGIYRDIDTATYFADPAPDPSLSQSICKVLLESSPAHAKVEHPRLRGEPPETEEYKKATAIGNAAHKLMLGRGKDIVEINADDFKTKDARQKRDETFRAGRVPILSAHYQDALELVIEGKRQIAHHEDRDAFTAGSAEVMIIWQEDEFWYRTLVDWLTDDLRTVDDFKTTGMSVAPHKLGHLAESAGWHVQAAFIERGLDALDPAGAGRRRFRFVAQEQYKPWALSIAHMDEHWLTMGRKQIAAADALWRRSISSRKWPAYPARGIVPDYPAYAEARWLDREQIEFSENNPKLIMAG